MYDFLCKTLCGILVVLFVSLPLAHAQQSGVPAAIVPAQITQARTIFLSNAGGDPLFTYYDGGTDRAYNDLYAALKNWGHFQVVGTPAAADLILEVRSIANESAIGVPPNSTTSYTPEIRLQLLDSASHTVLWTLNSYIRISVARKKTRDRQFDEAAAALFDQLRQLTGETLTPEQTKAAHRSPGPSRRSVLIWVAVTAAATIIPLAIILSHFGDKPKTPTLPSYPPFNPA